MAWSESGELLLAFAAIAVALIASGQSPIGPRGSVATASNDWVSSGSMAVC